MKTKRELGESLLWNIDNNILVKNKIDLQVFNRYIPKYLYEAQKYESSFFGKLLISVVPRLLGIIFKRILNPRSGEVGDLDEYEVDKVYSREAKTYNKKHHLTTRGIDTI